MNNKGYNTVQMGAAGEMLVTATLTLQGIRSFIMPPNWPGYDVIAETNGKRSTISVKCRHLKKGYIEIKKGDKFDWLAIVLIDNLAYRFFIIPQAKFRTSKNVKETENSHIVTTGAIVTSFGNYENNFKLQKKPKSGVSEMGKSHTKAAKYQSMK